MNQPEPLSPETVDLLLSAELDGDLDGAAHEVGLSASEAIAQLSATPGVDARRVALRRARELISARPPLDRSDEDRLVARALTRDNLTTIRERRRRRERQWRVLVATGSVAAAIAVIVGISSMHAGDSSKSSIAARVSKPERATASQDAGVSTPSGAVPAPPYFGDVTHAGALRIPARQLLLRSAAAHARNQDSNAKSLAPGTGQPTATPAPLSQSSFSANVPACGSSGAHYSVATRPALIATGTVSGQPVVILIYDGSGKPYADVIRVSDCTLVREQPLG